MSKRVGEIGELAFMLEARRKGFDVLIPYSNNPPYDLAIDNGEKTFKIQVKATSSNINKNGKIHKDAFKVSIAKGRNVKKKYKKNEVDFFAIYIIPYGIFYIIPFHSIETYTLNLYPEKLNHKLTKYLNNWSLIK